MQYAKHILAHMMVALSVVPVHALSVPAVCDGRGVPCAARERFDQRSCMCVHNGGSGNVCPAVVTDCEYGFRFDRESCRCEPEVSRDYRLLEKGELQTEMLSNEAASAQAALSKGNAVAALAGLGSLFDGALAQTASAAVPVQAGGAGVVQSSFHAVPLVLGRSAGFQADSRNSVVPAFVPSGGSARIIKVGNDTDANPLRHDNAVREAGTWGAAGAAGGAVTGGAVGAAAAGVSGAVAGAVSGHAADRKEKMEKDEKSYQAGNEATERDRRNRK